MDKASSQQAFVQLIARHQKLIHSLCSLYYPLPEDRKDLFQEIVLQLWKSYPSFSYQSKESTWLYRVAINTVFLRIRREKVRPRSEPLSDDALRIPEQEPDDATQELYRAIAQLADVDKALIMLYLEEHSQEEMAGMLGLSRTNISTKLNRIKNRLSQLLKTERV
ncbi:RNA polymerase sigma factor [Larkinella sp. VNQ87]|uniref:RNA polymerase sigma factor n=1 Tax=Larkinella sp. VNQ87 TaxID=3400921 RepID=UPI003C11E2FE